MALKKFCEMCEALVRPGEDGDCPKCGAGLQRVPADLMSALRDALPCRTCGGSGFIAEKRFIDDGYGEVDACPTCSPAPAGREK